MADEKQLNNWMNQIAEAQGGQSEYEALAAAFPNMKSATPQNYVETPDLAGQVAGADMTSNLAPNDPHAEFAQAAANYGQPRPALAPTGSISQDAIGAEQQAALEANSPMVQASATNLMAAQQAPEAFNVMQGAMAGTGIPANMPTPMAPVEAPQQLEPVNPVQQLAQDDAQRNIAQEAANQKMAEQQKLQAEVQQQENINQAADQKVAAQDSKAQGMDWGDAALQGLAVAMGEYGRYLTGGKENLAVGAIDRVVKQKAEKERLSAEETIAARKAALDVAQLKLAEEAQKTDSQLKRAQIAKIGAEIQTEKDKTAAQQKVAALIASGHGFEANEVNMLPEADRERMIMLPNGKYSLANVNKERLNKGQEVIDGANLGINDLRQLQKLTDYFGNNPGKKVLDREQISNAKTLAQTLKGRLRLSLLGPGAITDFEHKMLDNIIRDPTALLSLGSANKAALQTLMNKLETERRYTYGTMGVKLPPSVNDQNISALKRLNPSMSDAQAVDRLTKMGKWHND